MAASTDFQLAPRYGPAALRSPLASGVNLHEALGRRLDPTSTAPVGLALSGGGDSLALLALAAPWAGRHGRRLIAFTVDHGLNPDSPRWTAFAGDQARRLGAEPVALRWDGPKPVTGLPAAARAARHALIADAARVRGCAVVLFAHTADDAAEGEWMRARGASLGRLREWAPSPAWPQGRGVFLLRPLLGVSRATLRDHLIAKGLPWLEDPSNSDPRFLRSRARAARSDSSDSFFSTPHVPDRTDRAPFSTHAAAALSLGRARLGAAQLSAALLCASGGTAPPRGERLNRLRRRLCGQDDVVATLSDARVEAVADAMLFTREPGRSGLPDLSLLPGVEAVWDGRWLVATPEAGVTVRALAGLMARLSAAARRALSALPAAVRPTLPAFVSADGGVSCPPLEPSAHAARSLVADRFAAATGAVQCESDVITHQPLLAC